MKMVEFTNFILDIAIDSVRMKVHFDSWTWNIVKRTKYTTELTNNTFKSKIILIILTSYWLNINRIIAILKKIYGISKHLHMLILW